jgi:hypothetical protein
MGLGGISHAKSLTFYGSIPRRPIYFVVIPAEGQMTIFHFIKSFLTASTPVIT